MAVSRFALVALAALAFLCAPTPARADCAQAGGAVCDGVACGSVVRAEGTIQYNADYNVYQVCENNVWRKLWALGSGGCLNGYYRYGSSCYKFPGTETTWPLARAACQADGGDLVVINDAAEHAFINSTRLQSSSFWIGYTDAAVEGTWAWISPSTYTSWQTSWGEPNGGAAHDCAAIQHSATPGNFVDFACTDPVLYICEAPVVGSGCNSNWMISRDGADAYGREMLYQSGYLFSTIDHNSGDPAQVDITAWSFNGTSFTNIAQGILTGGYFGEQIAGDGTYLFIGDTGTRLHSMTFNGTSFTYGTSYNAGVAINDIFVRGGYIYLALGATGVRALSFNGTTFTAIATYNTPGDARSIWHDGTYVYVGDMASGVRALTFNGTTWTSLATYTAREARKIIGDGTYLHISRDWDGRPYALTFNGTSFTFVAEGTLDFNDPLLSTGGKIYFAKAGNIVVSQFSGTTYPFTGVRLSSDVNINSIVTDGNYIYSYDDYGNIVANNRCP